MFALEGAAVGLCGSGGVYPERCVCTGEPVVRAGGVHSQYGDLRLGGGRQAGQQQEHPETQILQTGEAVQHSVWLCLVLLMEVTCFLFSLFPSIAHWI